MDPATFVGDIAAYKDLTKAATEIVVTRFQEPLDWIRGLEHITTVYNHGEPMDCSATVIPTPNHGLDIETVLRHILTHYDRLADTTFFAQATLLDRADQPLKPLHWYLEGTGSAGFKAKSVESYDAPNSRYRDRLDDPALYATKGRTLGQFRKEVVGIPYRHLVEHWVPGNWFAVGRDRIRRKPLAYYGHLYAAAKFHRGIAVEEVFFLERSYWAIFNYNLPTDFRYEMPKSLICVSDRHGQISVESRPPASQPPQPSDPLLQEPPSQP
jgi:hypothetical protein